MVRIVFALLLAGCASQGSSTVQPLPPEAAAPSALPASERAGAVIDVSPWNSPDACQQAIAHGPRGGKDGLRITTWNARWFPLGHAPFDPTATGQPTDIEWMACAITWMDSDIVVLQEVLGSDEAKQAIDALVIALGTQQQASWSYRVMDCDDPDLQHVAVLYRDDGWDDVELADATTMQLSGDSDPLCSSSQRPALVSHFQLYDVPVTIAGVHLKSGTDARSYALRRDSVPRLVDGLAGLDEVIALGDFNSMGCYDCDEGKIAASAEIATLTNELATGGLSRIAPDFSCSEYSDDHAGLLDHIAIRGASVASAHVDGACRALACAPYSGDTPAPFVTLSDHCPLSIDLPLP